MTSKVKEKDFEFVELTIVKPSTVSACIDQIYWKNKTKQEHLHIKTIPSLWGITFSGKTRLINNLYCLTESLGFPFLAQINKKA